MIRPTRPGLATILVGSERITLDTGTSDRVGGLSARPVEYEAATTDWLSRTVGFLMLARDRLYADLQTEQVECLPDTRIDLGVGQELVIQPQPIAVTGSIEIDAVIAGDFDDLHAEVSSIADQKLEQTMRAYFALLMDVTQRTGNVADAHGDAAEGLLAALEKIDMRFDENGDPVLQMIVSPADEERVRAQMDALTPDQQRRFKQIIDRKREEYHASRRSRRLPRHGH